MIDAPQPSPEHRWATHADPDLLVLQLPPAPVVRAGAAHDAMKALLAQRGFRPVEETDRLDLRAANGCALTRTGPTTAELTVLIGSSVSGMRLAPTEGWLDRALALGHAAVLVADAAIADDGGTSRELLRRDVDAGGVVAALVPAAER